MPLRRLIRALGVALGVALTVPAGAIGFGAVPGSIGLGRPLDVAVPLRLEAGEAVPAGCLRADISVGERRLPPEAVAVRLEPSADGGVVRVRSAVALHEPVVEVGLTVGCAPSVSRRFTFLADPSAAAPPMAETAPAAPPAPGSNPGRPAAAPMSNLARPAAAPSGRASRGPVAAAPSAARQDAALTEAAEVASAARAAASAAQGQLAAMQAGMLALRAAAEADRRSIGQLREQLARADARDPSQPLAWGLSAALGLTAAGLGWRLRRLQRGHATASGRLQADPPAAVAPADDAPPVRTGAAAAEPTAALFVAAETRLERSAPLRGWAMAGPPGTAAGGVDELIDLEQQTEFFVVLGDDESAIELMLAYQRRTGMTSPLPPLKLLEIYRRRGDHEAGERTRRRFQQRFHADPPAGEGDADGGLGLLDHPSVLAALQRAWAVPIEAMALLEDLLFRRDGGEVLDLPSYRDALLLYGVARDVSRLGDAGAAPVDLLLPLTAGADRGAEAPYITAARPSRALPLDGAPGAPVDLDLGEIGGAGEPSRGPATPARPA